MTNNELIEKLLEKLSVMQPTYQKYKDYYAGKHKILNEPKQDNKLSDVRIVYNYPQKIVDMYTGYGIGKPITYQSKSGNSDFIADIDKYFSMWEKAHNVAIKKESGVCGTAYEVSYVSDVDGSFACTYFSPAEAIALTDGTVENNIKMLVRKYRVEFDNTDFIDVWDEQYYTKFMLKDNKLIPVTPQKRHIFSTCPVVEYPCNTLKQSLIDNIITIVDAYNQLNSESVSELADFRMSMLLMKGVEFDFEKAQEMKKNGIILLPSGKSDSVSVDWLTRNIPAEFFKLILERLEYEMYTQSRLPNLQESFASNTSGQAIRQKLNELENTIALEESLFEKALLKRMKLFCEYMKVAENKDYDARDLSINFTRNIPVDELVTAQVIAQLDGKIPTEELISWMPRITNPSLMMQKLEEQKVKEAELSKNMFNDMQFNDTVNDPVNQE